jgi:hypothetical protein
MRCDHESITNRKNRLQFRNRVSKGSLFLLLVASFTLMVTAATSTHADACVSDYDMSTPALHAAQAEAPQIVHSGFRAPPTLHEKGSGELTHFWLQLASVPDGVEFVVLEPVWGTGPEALSSMWSRAIPIRNQHVFVYPSWAGPHRDQAFTLGYRVRFVLEDGSVSAPSLPTFVSHSASSKAHGDPRTHQVLMALCCMALFCLWIVYRRDPDPIQRIRVAAAVGLVSVLFLATSPALSWVSVEDPSGRLATVDCHLGDEAQCATYVPDAGPNPLSMGDVAGERRFEVARWMSASSALRVGLILCLVLLMPALIWLLVAPTLRAAQSAMVFGATAAGYTFLAAICYRLMVPSWMAVQTSNALELTILTTANIVAAAGLVIYWSFQHVSEGQAPLPAARARIRDTRS